MFTIMPELKTAELRSEVITAQYNKTAATTTPDSRINRLIHEMVASFERSRRNLLFGPQTAKAANTTAAEIFTTDIASSRALVANIVYIARQGRR